jgi:hypothetical protein
MADFFDCPAEFCAPEETLLLAGRYKLGDYKIHKDVVAK